MGFRIMRCFEYGAECDECGEMDVLHTGDTLTINGQEIFVHDKQSAIKGLQYHRSKGRYLCDRCFKKMKEVKK